MTSSKKLVQSFKDCTGPFPLKDFRALMQQLGFKEVMGGRTSGSGARFVKKGSRPVVVHIPHGKELGKGMVKRIRNQLSEQGEL